MKIFIDASPVLYPSVGSLDEEAESTDSFGLIPVSNNTLYVLVLDKAIYVSERNTI